MPLIHIGDGWHECKQPLIMHPNTSVPHLGLVRALQVDKACSDLQMAALAALKPISSDLKAAVFDMASIPVTCVSWV